MGSIRPDKWEALRKRMVALGVEESDLQETFVRGSGPGGQKVNKSSIAVQLKHVPSGLEVKVQRERSRDANRFLARRAICDLFEEKVLGKGTRKTDKAAKARKQKSRRKRRSRSAHSDSNES